MRAGKFLSPTVLLQLSFLVISAFMLFVHIKSTSCSSKPVTHYAIEEVHHRPSPAISDKVFLNSNHTTKFVPPPSTLPYNPKEPDRVDHLPSPAISEEEFLNSSHTAMDDPRLIQIIKDKFLYPPSTLPYNLKEPDLVDYSQRGESPLFDEMFNRKEHGFFVECGAYDGEHISGSLFFEKTRHWSGLLVEGAPTSTFKELLAKNRKAYKANVCASIVPHPHQIKFLKKGVYGRVVEPAEENKLPKGSLDTVQCFPFYSLLLAVGNPTVDLFVLDVEGAETSILKTIPFDKVDIKYFYIEHNHVPGHKESIKEVMTANGFEFVLYNNFNVLYRKK